VRRAARVDRVVADAGAHDVRARTAQADRVVARARLDDVVAEPAFEEVVP